jgi:hypothetical protein
MASRKAEAPRAGANKRKRSVIRSSSEGQPSQAAKKKKTTLTSALAASVGDLGNAPPAGADSSEVGNTSAERTVDADSTDGEMPTEEPDENTRAGIDLTLRPISDVREMFEDMVSRVEPVALKKTPTKLNVATLCSGTDAPIIALSLIQDALQEKGFGAGFEFEHLFSCEIEPAKQGFIRRNLPHATVIFRDVIELANMKSTGEA